MKKLFCLLLLAGCASAPKATPPEWPSVPPTILNALCARMRGEGVARDSAISVVKTTQPIVTASSMKALGEAFYRRGDAVTMADALTASLKTLPVTIGEGGSCAWRSIDRIDARRDHETLVVQFSTPFINPYARGESGLFARMSVGGQAPQWYWIPVAERNGQWAIGMVLPLDLHEE